MKSDTADVVACNDDYGIAEMKIRVNKEFYDAKSGSSHTPIGFEVQGDDYIQVRVSYKETLIIQFSVACSFSTLLKVIRPDRSKMRLSSNHEDIEFHHALVLERGDSHTYGSLQVLFSPLYIIEFVCKYSLDMQVVSTSTKVRGSDIRLKRERRGELRPGCWINLILINYTSH